jgi:hypothetical protein
MESFLPNTGSARSLRSQNLPAYCNNNEIAVILNHPISSPDGFSRNDEAMSGDWPIIRVGDAEK